VTRADMLFNRYLRLAARKASPERDAEADLALADYLIEVSGPETEAESGYSLTLVTSQPMQSARDACA
jgi:hypothetical protein